ncbi:MAG: TIGR03668 family PPOX class F420-dependent oxidoreductase, partial [Gemmatimonadales bacterium]
ANLQATGHASILIDEYAEDWSRLWWIRLDGTGRIVTNETESTCAVTALRRKYPPYDSNPPEGPVLAIDVRHWTTWSATN